MSTLIGSVFSHTHRMWYSGGRFVLWNSWMNVDQTIELDREFGASSSRIHADRISLFDDMVEARSSRDAHRPNKIHFRIVNTRGSYPMRWSLNVYDGRMSGCTWMHVRYVIWCICLLIFVFVVREGEPIEHHRTKAFRNSWILVGTQSVGEIACRWTNILYQSNMEILW